MVERQLGLFEHQAVKASAARWRVLSLMARRRNLMFAYLEALLGAEFGLTDQEAAELLKVKPTTICGRRGDLRDSFPSVGGFVFDSGEKRLGDSRTLVTVWKADPSLLLEYRKKVSPDHRIDGTVEGVNA